MDQKVILEKLTLIEEKLSLQTLLQKEIFNVEEACLYLSLSSSHLYKLTSQKRIPHFCPTGKKIYFKRQELDEWILSNRQDDSSICPTKNLLKRKHI